VLSPPAADQSHAFDQQFQPPPPARPIAPAAPPVSGETRRLKQLVHELELAEATRPSLRELARRAGFSHPQQYKRAWERAQGEYKRYLRSAAWKARLDAVRAACGGTCEACGIAPMVDGHHTSYAHLGAEPLDDLLAVCAPCHRAQHPWAAASV
jgi:hypothetical protein